MYTNYHLASAQEVSDDLLDSIKATFKSKSITIIVKESVDPSELTAEMKDVLNERLQEDESTYLTEDESIEQIKKKYNL